MLRSPTEDGVPLRPDIDGEGLYRPLFFLLQGTNLLLQGMEMVGKKGTEMAIP